MRPSSGPKSSEDEDGKLDDDRKPNDKKKCAHQRPAWESDYYNDEVVRTVTDHLTLGSKALVSAPVHAKVDR